MCGKSSLRPETGKEGWQKFREIRKKMLDRAIGEEKADALIAPLLQAISENKGLVTLSSCAGRIVLLEFDFAGRKKTAVFFRKWHRKVKREEVELALSEHTGERPLWFKVEPFILHVAARNVAAAAAFLDKIRSLGVKRGGIQTIKKDKVTVEVQGNNLMVIPVGPVEGGWDGIIALGNQMLEDNYKLLSRLEKIRW